MRLFPVALAALTALCFAVGLDDASARASALRWKLGIGPDTAAKRNPSGRIEIDTPRGPQVYWYCVYSVKSTHDEAIPLHLNVTAETDASAEVTNEGYYPLALQEVRRRFGDDVMDNVSLNSHSLEAGQSIRAVAIFQLREPGSTKFEERVNHLTMKFDGVADPVKRVKQQHSLEKVQIWMHFEKKGDHHHPGREPVEFVSQEEKVFAG
jgi:hypothetical protein